MTPSPCQERCGSGSDFPETLGEALSTDRRFGPWKALLVSTRIMESKNVEGATGQLRRFLKAARRLRGMCSEARGLRLEEVGETLNIVGYN